MTSSFGSICLLVQHNSWEWINQLVHEARHLQTAQQLHIKAQVLTEQPLPHWASTSESLVSTTHLFLAKKFEHHFTMSIFLSSQITNKTVFITLLFQAQEWYLLDQAERTSHLRRIDFEDMVHRTAPLLLHSPGCDRLSLCQLSFVDTGGKYYPKGGKEEKNICMKDILNAHWWTFLIISTNFKPKSN